MSAAETVDVLIIGAGATGAAVAWRLGQTSLKVLCLEQGGHMDPARYPSTQIDWELARHQDFHVSPNVRQRPEDYPINDTGSPIAIANFNAVGGSTILFSAHFPRFHPSDFKVRTLDGVAEDWPLSYEQLTPYFAVNDRMMGVSGLGGDPAYPPIDGLLPPIPMGLMGERMGHGFNQLGWHWWPSYAAIATKPHGGRPACINLGPCNTGCAQGAKASTDRTYWPLALRSGVQLKTHARVCEITLDEHGKAAGALYFDADGNTHFQPARLVVIACNGVGTPRLLLNSCSPRFPDGLANRSGQVGRNLMLHPLGYVEGVFDDNLHAHRGPQGCAIYSHQFYETDPQRGFVRGYTLQVLRGPGLIETATSGFLRRDIPHGAGFQAALAARYGHTVGIGVITEDLPEPHNTVTLDANLTDQHGIAAPKINYTLSDNTRKMLTHGLDRGKEVMRAAGARKVTGFGPVRHTGWHLMGTARMGHCPQTSVVNAQGRCHDVNNLYIADSSVFVTSGGVNPVSTMQAVALHIADGIIQDRCQSP